MSYLFITIDTEEDNWGDYRSLDTTTRNLKGVIRLQKLFSKYNVVPTYLTNYAVLKDSYFIKYIKEQYEEGLCDLGTHCHPWNTPPFVEKRSIANTYLCNLNEDVARAKLKTMYTTTEEKIGISPTVFRSGRWGFGDNVLSVLRELQYRIDTSMTPYVDWGGDCGPVYSLKSNKCLVLYRALDESEGMNYHYERKGDYILEIPPTIGYLQQDFMGADEISIRMTGRISKLLHLRGLLDKTRIVTQRWLSPELTSLGDMKALTIQVLKKRYGYVNMSFHSTSLVAGLSPFVRSMSDEESFYQKIERYLDFAREHSLISGPLSKAESFLFTDDRQPPCEGD